MGAETEYAVSGREGTAALDHDTIYHYLREALCSQRAWATDHHGYWGVYLEHGGRFYLDYGSHPEHATAECFTPREVACHDKAGEFLLDLARARAERTHAGVRISILKNNLDPIHPDSTSYGTHESYTCWVDPDQAAEALLGHLVSRVLYAGSGGLSGRAEGMGFELSQRARHINEAVGCDTTCNRPIFGMRVRKETDQSAAGWTRVHLISKDSQRAPFGIYLTYATTGLLIEMLNRGLTVGQGVRLEDPVQALHTLALDPRLKARVPLVDGRQLTALQMQSIYLEECERALQKGYLPGWSGEAISHWRQTLAALERDPLSLADRLDPYCKLLIYDRELQRAGRTWEDLHRGLKMLRQLRCGPGDGVLRAILTGEEGNLDEDDRAELASALKVLGAGADLKRELLSFALRMQMIDVNYHELGGLYDRLRAAGRMRDVILTAADVEKASRTPPPGGRAAARGSCIRDHQEGDWRADWQYVWQVSTGRCFDLRDPFQGVLQETRLILPKEDYEPAYIDVLDQLSYPPEQASGAA
jgi:proteasome accessory factor A